MSTKLPNPEKEKGETLSAQKQKRTELSVLATAARLKIGIEKRCAVIKAIKKLNSEQKEASVSRLAKILSHEKSYVRQLASEMVKHGYLSRRGDRGYEFVYKLTGLMPLTNLANTLQKPKTGTPRQRTTM